MDALGRTVKVGLTIGLSFGAIVGLIGCNDPRVDGDTIVTASSLETMNGLSMNGLSMNGLSMNGLSMNGLSMNGLSMKGLSMNGLATVDGLSNTAGLMTTAGGRDIVKYMVRCALPAGQSLTKQDQNGVSYTFDGAIGIAPEALNSACDMDCQERISACMLAHVNNSGTHISIWLDGPDAAIGWGSSPAYPYQEGAYFGNLIANPWQGYYCLGKDMGSGEVPGRLGTPLTTNVYDNAYGWEARCANNCVASNEGFSQCSDPLPKAPNAAGHTWNHVVTVWRNFESTQMYKICTKSGPTRCLGAVNNSTADGASIEHRTYSGSSSQHWQILQVESGKYKFVNVASGKALDLNGTAEGSQVVQRSYSGTASQKIPVVYFSDQAGFANLKPSSGGLSISGSDTAEGLLMKLTSNNSPDYAKWSFTAVGTVGTVVDATGAAGSTGTAGTGGTGGTGGSTSLFSASRTYRLVPQSATSKSLDVCGGSQNNGTCVQQYATSSTNNNQAFNILPSGSNWKITMKANTNKCLGTGSTANGAAVVIQDCNGSSYQAFTVSQDGGTGIYRFKLAANPNQCLDMTNAGTTDGTKVQLYSCWAGNSQRFSVQ